MEDDSQQHIDREDQRLVPLQNHQQDSQCHQDGGYHQQHEHRHQGTQACPHQFMMDMVPVGFKGIVTFTDTFEHHAWNIH